MTETKPPEQVKPKWIFSKGLLGDSKWRIPLIILIFVFAIAMGLYQRGRNTINNAGTNLPAEKIIFTLPESLKATDGTSYSYSFCEPDSAISGATCGELAGATTNPTGGNPPYSFSVQFEGLLPPGIALEPNGLLKGKPFLPGEYSFGVCASDGQDKVCKDTILTVASKQTIKPTPTPIPKTSCPANSHKSSSDPNKCDCDTGYKTNSAGDGCEVAPTGMPVRGKVTDKDTGNLVGGAIIRVAYQEGGGIDKSIVVSSGASATDTNGNNYLMYLPYYLPSDVIISVNAGGYLPMSKNVIIDTSLEQQKKHLIVDFALIPISEKVIVIDNQLHHLGDDSYEGAVNSQFQLSAEGLQYSKSFTVSEQQLKYTKASLIITNKGTQEPNQITLNGQNIGALCCSSSSGGFGTLRWEFEASILKQGLNQITINSAANVDANASAGDHDDFEFTDAMIELQ